MDKTLLDEALDALQALTAQDTDRCCRFCEKIDWGIHEHKGNCPFKLAYETLAKAGRPVAE